MPCPKAETGAADQARSLVSRYPLLNAQICRRLERLYSGPTGVSATHFAADVNGICMPPHRRVSVCWRTMPMRAARRLAGPSRDAHMLE
eukprot:scaffold25881_cov129-Isochrysis_galbana.AAC.5